MTQPTPAYNYISAEDFMHRQEDPDWRETWRKQNRERALTRRTLPPTKEITVEEFMQLQEASRGG